MHKALQFVVKISLACAGIGSTVSMANTTPVLEPVNQPNVSLAQAEALINAAKQEAAALKCNAAIAVVDWSGDLIAFARNDLAGKVSISVAQGKARTSALIQNPSKHFEEFINKNGQNSMLSIDTLMPLQGGVPVYYQGKFTGAIGVSGCPGGHLDEQVAINALTQLGLDK